MPVITQVTVLLATGMPLPSGTEKNAGVNTERAIVSGTTIGTTIGTMIAGTGMNGIIADQIGMKEIEAGEMRIMVMIILTETVTQMRILMTGAPERMSLIVGSTA